MSVPAAVFEVLKTITTRQAILVLTPTGGSATNLLVDNFSDVSQLTVGRTGGIGASNGPAYTASAHVSNRAEMYRARTKEIKKIVTAFGGLSFFKTGTCTIFKRDPRDATDVVALKSEDTFACAFYRDAAEIAGSPAGADEITIMIESLKDGEITWSPDADVSA